METSFVGRGLGGLVCELCGTHRWSTSSQDFSVRGESVIQLITTWGSFYVSSYYNSVINQMMVRRQNPATSLKVPLGQEMQEIITNPKSVTFI